MTKTISIPNPKILEREKELVLIPRREYEALLRTKFKKIKEVILTADQRKAIERSHEELRRGDYLTLNELEKYLARSRAKARR